MSSNPRPKHALRHPTAWIVASISVLLLAVVALVLLGWHHSNLQQNAVNARISKLSAAVSQNARAAHANQSALAQANHCIRVKCSQPVPTPTVEITGPQGVPGPQGAPGHSVTAAEVERAVAAYCAANTCNATPTMLQVAAAIATYCSTNNGCAGPPGSTGPSGAAAPPLTSDQILAGVGAYCDSHGGCAGPPGAAGAPGPSGAAGAAGQPPDSWTFPIGPVTYQCDRASGFDLAKPSYTCAPLPLAASSTP